VPVPLRLQLSEKGTSTAHSDWQHSMVHPRKTTHRGKQSCRYLLRPTWAELYPILSQISLPWQRGSVGEKPKNAIGSIQRPIPETPYMCEKTRRYFSHKLSNSNFCPKICCHGNVRWSGKIAIASIQWRIPKKFPTGAQILQISLTQAEL